jgi:hypothetical protein
LKHTNALKLLTSSCAVIVVRETFCKALCAMIVVSRRSLSYAWPLRAGLGFLKESRKPKIAVLEHKDPRYNVNVVFRADVL